MCIRDSLPPVPTYRLDAAQLVDLAPGVGGRMEPRRHRPDAVEQGGRGGVLTYKPIEHALGGKPPHHHRDLERAAPALEARRLRATLDLHDAEIDVGRKTPVEPHLVLGESPSQGKRGEVEESEVHRLLDLVHAVPGEK